MNPQIISKEELLAAAKELIREDGIEKLSMRRLASRCRISVGCIYNYYPAKSDLLLALTEEFWASNFRPVHTALLNATDFRSGVENLYRYLIEAFSGFSSEFLRQLSSLDIDNRHLGREKEAEYWNHMKHGLLRILMNDTQISPTLWDECFTREAFIDFVFDSLIRLVRQEANDCSFLLSMISRLLYNSRYTSCSAQEPSTPYLFTC